MSLKFTPFKSTSCLWAGAINGFLCVQDRFHVIRDLTISAFQTQIRTLISDPSYSSASGQYKAVPVTQIGGENLSERWRAAHGRVEKEAGGGLRCDERKEKTRGKNDKGWEERWGP